MKTILSASREVLLEKLFVSLEEYRTSSRSLRQVIVVPDRSMAAWIWYKAASLNVFLLDVEIRVAPQKTEEGSVFHFFGFCEVCLVDRNVSIWYVFSPCGHFWSDLLSERELGKKVARTKGSLRNRVQEALEQFYSETNSLLSNAATFGKKSAQTIEELSQDVEAYYPVPKKLLHEEPYLERVYDEELFIPQAKDVTLLSRIQADLIFLVGSRSIKQEVPPDHSVGIVGAPTIYTEGVALIEQLHSLSKQQPIQLGDVLVLTPAPSLYASVIQYLLPHLKVQILYEERSGLFKKLEGIFDCIRSRFDKKDLISLLSLPEMNLLLDCDGDELFKMRSMLASQKLTWGVNSTFRQTWLHEACIVPEKDALHAETVHDCFCQKLRLLCEGGEDKEPLDAVWKNLLKFFSLVEKLASLWELPLVSNRKEHGASWSKRVEETVELFSALFSSDDHQVLSACLLQPHQEEMSFQEFVERFLECIRKQQHKTTQVLLGHVLVGSLAHTTPFPARYIAFLGMGEEEMRRFVVEESQRTGVDRFLLQESLFYSVIDGLMQAKEQVSFSFLNWDFELREKKEPSTIVQLIQNYVEGQFQTASIYRDRRVMVQKGRVHSKASSKPTLAAVCPVRMDVERLMYALSDPLSYYLQTRYGQKRAKKSHEELALFASTRQLEELALQELVRSKAKYKRGQTRGVSQSLLQRELLDVQNICTANAPADIRMRQHSLVRRPIHEELFIEGVIQLYPPFASCIVTENVEKAIREGLWARFSLLSCLKEDLEVEPAVFFALQGEKKELLSIDREAMERFCMMIHHQPVPLTSDFLGSLLDEESSFSDFEEVLEEKIEDRDRTALIFSLIVSPQEREERFLMWKEQAARLIQPWIVWGGS